MLRKGYCTTMIVTGMLLLSALIIVPAHSVNAGGNATGVDLQKANASLPASDGLLISMPNSTDYWYTVTEGGYGNWFNVTLSAVSYFHLQINYSSSSFGIFVNQIGGYWNNNTTFSPSWSLWVWNSTSSQWSLSNFGISSSNLTAYTFVAWSFSYLNTTTYIPYFPPQATPLDPFPAASFRLSSQSTGKINAEWNEPFAPPSPHIEWYANTSSGGIDTQPLLYNGMIYVFTDGGTAYSSLVAYNSFGDTVWTEKVPGRGFQLATPLAVSGSIFVASTSGYLYGFNASTGREIFSDFLSNAPFGFSSSPVLGDEGIYVINDSGGLYSISFNGTVEWELKLGYSSYYTSPVLNDNFLYIGTNESNAGQLIAVNLTSRSVAWKVELQGGVFSTPAAGNGDIYIISSVKSDGSYSSNTLSAINSTDGFLLWNYSIGPTPGAPSSILLTGSEALFGAGGNLTAVSTTSGKFLWSFHTGNQLGSPSPTSFGGYIFASTNSAESGIYVLNSNGTLVWARSTLAADYSLSSPVYNGNALYWGDDNGFLYSISTAKVVNFSYTQKNGTVELYFHADPALTGPFNVTWVTDNVTEYGQNTSFHFLQNGTFSVRMQVRYSQGTYTTYTSNITVNSVVFKPVRKGAVSGYQFLLLSAVIILAAVALIVIYFSLKGRKKWR